MQLKTSFKPLYRVSKSFVPITGFCVKCGSETIKHDDNDHVINGTFEPYEVTVGPHTVECPSGHNRRGFKEVWHTCLKCGENSLECDECNRYMRIIKIPGEKCDESGGIETDGEHYKVVKKEDGTYTFELKTYSEMEEEEKDENYDYTISIPVEMQMYSINFKEWYLTGMDGSKHSEFKCDFCDKVVEIYDD